MEGDAATVEFVVRELLEVQGLSREQLAASLRVSASAVARWQAGASSPRPRVEGQLRALFESVREDRARYAVQPQAKLDLGDEADIRTAIDKTLRQLREAFHRRSRLAGRSEALDEVSKLLFAHVLSLANEKRGIDRSLFDAPYASMPAVALRSFVSNAVAKYLPTSLAHEMHPEEFQLRLKEQESELAAEVINCFDELSQQSGIVGERGIEAVDLLNEVFGKFLADSFVDEKQLGQYLTPTEVVRFMVQLAIAEMDEEEIANLSSLTASQSFGYVIDPSCGVASFLAEFIRAFHGRISDDVVDESEWIDSMLRNVVVGVDKSERMLRYALTNLAMFGIPAAHLKLANAISKQNRDGADMAELDGRVGLILTNPPFGAEFTPEDTLGYKISTRGIGARAKLSSECLFLERYLDWLRPGGQLLAIVPDSILTNQGVFAELRRQIQPDVFIRNIVSLPTNTFAASGTTTKTSILHLRKKGHKETKCRTGTLVSVCNDIGYDIATRSSHRVKTTRSPGDLPRILDMIRNQNPDSVISKFVLNLEQLPRWDANFYLAISGDLERSILQSGSSGVQVSDVADLSNDRHDPRRGTGQFLYIEISDVDGINCTCRAKKIARSEAPSRARKLVRAGDVLVSTVRPERRTIGVVGAELDGATCTTGFAVLRPRNISPLVLAALLKTDTATAQVLKHNVGIAYPAVDEKCLPGVFLPVGYDRLDELGNLASKIEELQTELRPMRSKFDALIQSPEESAD